MGSQSFLHEQWLCREKRCFNPARSPQFSYRGEDVVQTLEATCALVGYPKSIRVDQGSEIISRDVVRGMVRHREAKSAYAFSAISTRTRSAARFSGML